MSGMSGSSGERLSSWCVSVCVGGWVKLVDNYVATFGAQSPHLLIFNGPFHLQANLRQKVTHSMQTDLSHYKRDNATQVYLPRYTWMNLTRQPFRVIFTIFFITIFLLFLGIYKFFIIFYFYLQWEGDSDKERPGYKCPKALHLHRWTQGPWRPPSSNSGPHPSYWHTQQHHNLISTVMILMPIYISAHTHTILNTTHPI